MLCRYVQKSSIFLLLPKFFLSFPFSNKVSACTAGYLSYFLRPGVNSGNEFTASVRAPRVFCDRMIPQNYFLEGHSSLCAVVATCFGTELIIDICVRVRGLTVNMSAKLEFHRDTPVQSLPSILFPWLPCLGNNDNDSTKSLPPMINIILFRKKGKTVGGVISSFSSLFSRIYLITQPSCQCFI